MKASGCARELQRAGGKQPLVGDTDAAVIARSLDDPRAFGLLFDRYASVLLRFLLRRVVPAEAEGLLGEVFRIAFERRHSYDMDRACARPWLYGIAGNVVAKHRRSEARRRAATARLAARSRPADDLTGQVDAVIDAGHSFARVAAVLAALPDAERDAILLYAWEDLTYDEIAAVQHVPVGTVRSRLARARRRLRAFERPDGGASPAQAGPTRLKATNR